MTFKYARKRSQHKLGTRYFNIKILLNSTEPILKLLNIYKKILLGVYKAFY